MDEVIRKGEELDLKKIAERAGMTAVGVELVLHAAEFEDPISLEEPLSDEYGLDILADIIADSRPDVEQIVMASAVRKRIVSLLHQAYGPKNAALICGYHGLREGEEESPREIAIELGYNTPTGPNIC